MKLIKFILFNRFTKTFIKLDFGGADNKTHDRIKAFMAEIAYTSVIFFQSALFLIIPTILIQNLFGVGLNLVDIVMHVLLFGLCIVSFNKDFYNGQSVVNRSWGYQVVDIKTGNTASQLKCMLRSSTSVIFPLEIPFVLLNRERRLGDFIAGTKLIKVEKSEPTFILAEIENTHFRQETIITLIIPTLLFTIWTIWTW